MNFTGSRSNDRDPTLSTGFRFYADIHANEISSFRRRNERFPFADHVRRKLRCLAGTNIPG